MPISTPDKIITPWATSGLKDNIPENADPLNGRAGFDLGFPPINLTPRTAGGIPPFGQDFNGIFFDITQALQFLQAGGSFPYDGTWATAVGGYPVGALVSRTDNQGLWRNTVVNNLTDPEAGGAGWQPEGSGATAVTMTSSNVTLTPLQAAPGMIIITGTLTANLQLIFPEYVKQWLVVNNTTGAFTITCKTASGTGVDATQGAPTLIYGDGTDIGASAQTGFDFLNTVRVDVAAASSIDLGIAAPNTRHIRLTGTATINNFTVATGQFYFVTVGAAQTVVNSASIVTQYGANISMQPGDTYCIGATAANVVYVWGYVKNIAEFPFTEVYESGELTFSAGNQVGPLAHGLGGYPKFITYEYRCIVADAGYAVGDRVFVNQPTGQSASDGLAMVGTATQLDGRWGSTRVGAFLSKGSGAITNLTSTSWRVVVKAYI